MNSSTPVGHRAQTLHPLLAILLHPDVIPLVMGYEATIQFTFIRSFGNPSKAVGNPSLGRWTAEGDMNLPQGIALYGDELLIMDTYNHRIQIFHKKTGRFLRKWGRYGREAGEFLIPTTCLITADGVPGEEKVFVGDYQRKDIQVFQLSDLQFLNRFPTTSGGPRGITVLRGELFVSHDDPVQIDVMTRSEGKLLRVLWKSETGWGFPSRLSLDEDTNEVFMVDGTNTKIIGLDTSSGHCRCQYDLEEDRPGLPPRAAVPHGDEVIVVDTSNHRLVLFDRRTCQLLRSIGERGQSTSPVEFSWPSDLLVSPMNELFVCDSGNNRVLMFE